MSGVANIMTAGQRIVTETIAYTTRRQVTMTFHFMREVIRVNIGPEDEEDEKEEEQAA